MIKRRTDWRARLSAAIEAKRRTPFAYGENDCGLFMADCVLAVTGFDIAAPYRGRYLTLVEGLRLLRANGHDDLCALLAAHFVEIAPVLARAGDVMAFSLEGGWAVGIVNGERVTVLRPDGLGTVSRDTAERAFRCPG